MRGFTEALRMDLDMEGAPVSATCVPPGGIGTNIALASKIDPVMEQLTGKSVDAYKRRVLVGDDAKRLDIPERSRIRLESEQLIGLKCGHLTYTSTTDPGMP